MEYLHNKNKTSPSTLTQYAKGTALIARHSILHDINENRLSRIKPNSMKVGIFPGATI